MRFLHLFEGELDTGAFAVNGDDSHLYMLVEGDYLCGVGDTAVSHLGYVYESVFVDAQIDERAEIGDVGYDSR